MNNIKMQISLGVVCLVMGFVITLQMRSVNQSSSSVQTRRLEELSLELSSQKDINADLLEQILSLTNDLDMYRNEASKTSGTAMVLSERLSRAEIIAGLVGVEGEGVVVTLNDSKNHTQGDSLLEIVHDDDIRRIVSELYASGAEAVSINDERLISQSAIRCVGPTILVNNARFSPPYVIKAIGNPDTMEAAINMRDGAGDFLRKTYRIEVDVRKEKNVSIPRYTGVVNFKYAAPAKEVTP